MQQIQISYAKPLANKKGGRLREVVRSGDISVEKFLKLFHS